MLKVILIPALSDNYIFLIIDEDSRKTAVVDPTTFEDVDKYLKENNLTLNYILNTHHHFDHIGGNKKLKEKYNCTIYGYKDDASRIPDIDGKLSDGQILSLFDRNIKIDFLPGHTLGHISYFFIEDKLLFCGDTLFAMGCGRLFEGDANQMFKSLQKISNLPKDTKIYCAHEYTESNAQFAKTIEPENKDLLDRFTEVKKLRSKNIPTIPSNLELELKTNPFLRCENAEEFFKIRKLKDNF